MPESEKPLLYFAAFMTLILTLMISCDTKGNKANLLNPDVKYRSDTMYARRRSAITTSLDSLCLERQDKFIAESVDSLMKVSQKQNDQILNPKK